MAGARIAIVEGPDSGKEVELSGTMTVGREGDVALNDSETSRSHASLSWDGTALTVQDLGSTNGTFVNEERLAGPRQVGPGDKLRIGTSVLELRGAADDDATRMREAPDFSSTPPPAGPPGGVGGPPGGAPAAAGPPSSMPPPGPPPGPPPAGPPPPAYAPPPAYGSAPPPYAGASAPPYSPGGMLAASPYAAPGGGQLSGWWRRVGATLLDFVISLPFLIFIYVLVVSPILMARDGPNNGQTWGKQALGIRVVRDTGQPFTYGTALLRDFVVKSLLFGVIGIIALIDALWPLWDEQNQALHDKLLSTHVLQV